MNGEEFYQFLMEFYHVPNQFIYGNVYFVQWLPKNDGSFNLQFRFLNNEKSIPKQWFVDVKNAMNAGEPINRNWFNIHFDQNNFNDCRASVAIYLLQNH